MRLKGQWCGNWLVYLFYNPPIRARCAEDMGIRGYVRSIDGGGTDVVQWLGGIICGMILNLDKDNGQSWWKICKFPLIITSLLDNGLTR